MKDEEDMVAFLVNMRDVEYSVHLFNMSGIEAGLFDVFSLGLLLGNENTTIAFTQT